MSSLAPENSVRVLVNKLCLNYERATGSNGSVGGRRASAGAMAAIASRSPVVFGDGGRSDLFRRKVLPGAFVGLADEDEIVSKAWKTVWEEGGGAYSSNNTWDEGKVGVRLEEKLLDVIVEWSVHCLSDVSWAYRKSACVGIKRLCELGVVGRLHTSSGEKNAAQKEREERRARCSVVLLKALLGCLKGRVWGGKNVALEAASEVICSWGGSGESGEEEKHSGVHDILEIYAEGGGDDLFEGDGYFIAEQGLAGAGDMSDGKEEEKEEEEEEQEVEGGGGGEVEGGLEDMDVDGKLSIGEEGEELAEDGGEEGGGGDIENGRDDAMEVTTRLSLLGICKLFFAQSKTKSSATFALPYKIAALAALTKTATSFTSHSNMYEKLEPMLKLEADEGDEKKLPPVILSKRINALGALVFESMGAGEGRNLAERLRPLIKHEAWTVREAVGQAMGAIAERVALDRTTVAIMNENFVAAAVDRKFAKVRIAGYSVLKKLVKRAEREEGGGDKAKVKELIVVFQEQWTASVRKGLQDNDTDVTQLCSELIVLLGRWS